MSQHDQINNTEQYSIRPYVIGFILSLIFTLVPYYLVVNQVVIGRALLYSILMFAIIQLFVQITFFLHLGRGPNPRWNVYFFIMTIAVILITVGGSIVIIDNLHGNLASSDQNKRLINNEGIYQIGGETTGACQGSHDNYKVTIENDKVVPLLTVASKCDTEPKQCLIFFVLAGS